MHGDASSSSPFATRKKAIMRHELNNRYQSGVKAAYKASLRLRGIVEGVRGEAWVIQPEIGQDGQKSSGYQALSFASLTESFYAALVEDPTNESLLLTLSKGLEVRLLSNRMPKNIIRYLVNLHNRFHKGSGTSFVELIKMVPDVTWLGCFSYDIKKISKLLFVATTQTPSSLEVKLPTLKFPSELKFGKQQHHTQQKPRNTART